MEFNSSIAYATSTKLNFTDAAFNWADEGQLPV